MDADIAQQQSRADSVADTRPQTAANWPDGLWCARYFDDAVHLSRTCLRSLMIPAEQPQFSAKLLSAAEFDAYNATRLGRAAADEAREEMLREAKQEARSIIDRAKDNAAELLARRTEALDEDVSAWVEKQKSQRLGTELAALDKEIAAIGQTFEKALPAISDLIIQTTKKVIGAMPDAKKYRMIVQKALDDLPTGCAVTLEVAPDRAGQINDAIKAAKAEKFANLSVNVNPNADAGAMRLLVQEGSIDFGLADQFSRIEAVLQETLGRVDSEGSPE
ncbi:hypothetical protein [Yoonia sp. SS1-5]|uniref:Flagellar assembly protein FliH/Type III secretion system HrpE domain-containing protein n=1 Tax=Yoonia rhodophyticola TaxID=3137370 RepID=A0AAN0NKC8_9RHOB